MTEEWYLAARRLQGAVRGSTFAAADVALDAADGDEMAALGLLTDAGSSDIKRQREVAAMNAGPGRVSALKEAELRRVATGSARDFFKGNVEVAGDCVEVGIIDEDADVMGKLSGAFSKLFGKKE
jgi:hypothetical protein